MKPKVTFEIVALGIIYLAFASLTIYSGITFSKTIYWVQLHTIITSLLVGVVFFGNVFYLYPTIFTSAKRKYWSISIIVLTVCFLLESLVHAYKASALIKDQRGLDFDPYYMLFQPFNLEESIPVVFGTFVLSLVYAFIKKEWQTMHRTRSSKSEPAGLY